MNRFSDMKAYIFADTNLATLAAGEKYEEIAEILNAMTVPKLGPVTPSWLLTFLGIEGLWIKIFKISQDSTMPDDNMIKNACAILINYLQSGNPNPLDFSTVERQSMLNWFVADVVITDAQYNRLVTKCTYRAPFVVEMWGGSLTSADEIFQVLARPDPNI